MKLTSLVLRGFRCFDHTGQIISVDDFAGFVGPNASGKTAALMALVRPFLATSVHETQELYTLADESRMRSVRGELWRERMVMEKRELQQLEKLGEDSGRQFKADVTNPDSFAAELVTFSNSRGGTILIGVSDDGTLVGLSAQDVRRINQLIGNAATQGVRTVGWEPASVARSRTGRLWIWSTIGTHAPLPPSSDWNRREMHL